MRFVGAGMGRCLGMSESDSGGRQVDTSYRAYKTLVSSKSKATRSEHDFFPSSCRRITNWLRDSRRIFHCYSKLAD